jgi:cysteinyl-tRNA synthetase
MMSLFQQPAAQFLIDLDDLILKKKNLKRSDIDLIVNDRKLARENKDFAKSDELRKKLDELGISVMDFPGGSFWEVGK